MKQFQVTVYFPHRGPLTIDFEAVDIHEARATAIMAREYWSHHEYNLAALLDLDLTDEEYYNNCYTSEVKEIETNGTPRNSEIETISP